MNQKQQIIPNHSQNSTHSSTLLERQSSRTALIQNDSESNDSSESELETPSRDRVRVSFTSDTGVSAQFRRDSQSNKDSDPSSSSANVPESIPTPSGDAASLDTATIASIDSVDIPKIHNENIPQHVHNSPNANSCHSEISRPSAGRVQSTESLDSVGSETFWGDFTTSEA